MDNQVVDRICKFAFAMAVIGVCIVGACPACGIMALVINGVFKKRELELTPLNQDRLKKATFLSIASLFMFVIDIAILLFVFK